MYAPIDRNEECITSTGMMIGTNPGDVAHNDVMEHKIVGVV